MVGGARRGRSPRRSDCSSAGCRRAAPRCSIRSKRCGANSRCPPSRNSSRCCGETADMAFDTLRSNKMRSALTVLGVVIGVTSIVGMTSLIRGFDTSLRNSINSLGPNTIFVQRFGGLSFSSGASFMELMRRPLDHRRRHAGDRAAGDHHRHGRHLARRRRSRHAEHRAHVLPRRADAAGADHGHHRELRRHQLREDARRPLVHRAGSGARAATSR